MCCAVLLILILINPHHFGNLDPHPYQLKIRIWIRIKAVDPQHDFTECQLLKKIY